MLFPSFQVARALAMQRGAPPESLRNVVNKDELREVAIELLLKEAVQVRRKKSDDSIYVCVCVCVCVRVCVCVWCCGRHHVITYPLPTL